MGGGAASSVTLAALGEEGNGEKGAPLALRLPKGFKPLLGFLHWPLPPQDKAGTEVPELNIQTFSSAP